jgi:hypothetical protein
VDERHTRLILRIRFRHHWTDQRILLDLFTEFADHVAVPRMLLGIQDRVEGRRVEPMAAQGFEIAVWMAAFLEFVACIIFVLVWQRWWRVWIIVLLAGFTLLNSRCTHASRPGSGPCWYRDRDLSQVLDEFRRSPAGSKPASAYISDGLPDLENSSIPKTRCA